MTSTDTRAEGQMGTGSRTIADLLARAGAKYGDAPAVRHKVNGTWEDVSYNEVTTIISELGRGLIDLGLEPGDRVCILANTAPEWSYADFAITSAGLVVVPIYQTNSPKECAWVAGNSEARAIVCQDAGQLAKVAQIRDELPALEFVIAFEPADGAISFDELRARGRERDPAELAARSDAVQPDDPFTFIYTSGTTGPPKGCVLTHHNYRSIVQMCIDIGVFDDAAPEVTYLFLPLAHAFALLIQLLSFDLGGVIAYFGGDTKQIVPELAETHPTYLPSVPRIFEKIYTLVTSNAPAEQIKGAVEVGVKVRDLQLAGEPVPAELQAHFDKADELLFANVRNVFGGNVRQAVTGAAPIAPEILRFFWACGVPVLEGYGMTETSTAATYSTVESHRWGTVGRAIPGCEVRIADDGEILLKGANIFRGYYKNDDASFGAVVGGWLHTGDLGSLDEDGFLSITGRKKDIIITAGGKNLTPANLENDMRQSRWVSCAMMHGDRRPYPVMLITLDEEEIVPWAKSEGIEDTSVDALSRNDRVKALIQAELDAANAHYAQVEQVKAFFILDHDLSQETGELTPTLKVKRNVVNEKYSDQFDALYRR
jgi:long-chain acyl-CoA synthetase